MAVGIQTKPGCHSFRATGIRVYLKDGGLLEHAQQVAAHESARTTKLYDRRNNKGDTEQICYGWYDSDRGIMCGYWHAATHDFTENSGLELPFFGIRRD